MKVRAVAFVAALILGAKIALAEPAIDSKPRPAGQLELGAHFGVATVPFDVTTLRQAKGQAFVLLAGARYALTDPLSLELRAPLVLGSVAQPAGSYVDAAAWGNPELGIRQQLLERSSPRSALALSGAVELGAPIASHDENLMPNRVLAIADGIEGRAHPEWFTPGMFPITTSAALSFQSGSWALEAELRAPLLVRVSEADLPSGSADTKSLALAGIVALELHYRLSRRLSLAPAAQLFVDVAPAAARLAGVSRVQDFERLSLHVHFGSNAALAVDLQTAIGGDLGGSTVAGGLRFSLNVH